VKSKTLQALVKEHVEAGSTSYTDNYVAIEALIIAAFLISSSTIRKLLYLAKAPHELD